MTKVVQSSPYNYLAFNFITTTYHSSFFSLEHLSPMKKENVLTRSGQIAGFQELVFGFSFYAYTKK